MFWIFGPKAYGWDLHSPTRDWTHTPCTERRSLNYWTTKEVPEDLAACKWGCTLVWMRIHTCVKNTNIINLTFIFVDDIADSSWLVCAKKEIIKIFLKINCKKLRCELHTERNGNLRFPKPQWRWLLFGESTRLFKKLLSSFMYLLSSSCCSFLNDQFGWS